MWFIICSLITFTATSQFCPIEKCLLHSWKIILCFHSILFISRRPSLDLNSMVSSQSTLAGILCQAHANKQQGGTLSAGNTLTRLGSRHTAVEYAVPHHFHHPHHAYVEYHQDHMSLSDDDSSSEPGYDCIRTGKAFSIRKLSWFFNFLCFYVLPNNNFFILFIQ